ncbi:MAG TPA: hypothetical protein VD905_12820 [Flavobacteriales bacterium]|nr:hypothetical protein [Flavobacteriales bacterium]
MNKTAATEIVWFLAFAVSGLGAYYALGIQQAFENLIEGFGKQPLAGFNAVGPARLIFLCFLAVAFIGYIIRIIMQKGQNAYSLLFFTGVLLIGFVIITGVKNYIHIVGVDFRNFKLSLLGTGGNLFPEAARLINWLNISLGVSGVMMALNGYFLYKNYVAAQHKKPLPATEPNTDPDAPIDQISG